MMKKITLIALLAFGCVALLSAGGKEEQLYAGYGPGRMWDEPAEILEVEGTLQLGEYGHLEVLVGGKHYLLGHEEMFNPEILDEYLGKDAQLDGFEGPVMFTRGDEEFLMFHPLKVTVAGETLEIEGPMMGFGRGRGRGPGMHGRGGVGPCFQGDEGQWPGARRGNR